MNGAGLPLGTCRGFKDGKYHDMIDRPQLSLLPRLCRRTASLALGMVAYTVPMFADDMVKMSI